MFKRILKDKKAKIALIFLLFLVCVALVAPLIPNIDANAFNPDLISEPEAPSLKHWFGTDDFGRDIMVRIIFGARISLAVGVVSVGISLLIGILYGLFAGYLGGYFDEIMMRLVDLFMAIPTIFLILTIQVILKPNIFNVMVVIGVTSWMGVARLVRAEVLSVKERIFITAAKARGICSLKVVFKHILPLTLNPIIVAAMLRMGTAILLESVLSFLGLGVQPPHASWGNMLENSLSYMLDAPWMALIPGVFITLTVLALNFLGDGLRSAFNPE
jgi:peptide/nickel transport system permease protein